MFTMDEDYLLSTVRYVEKNPVVARLCIHPEDWKWSSACAHIKGEDDKLVSVKPMLDRIDRWSFYLSDADKNKDEDLIELHSRTGRPLGCTDFVRKLEVITGEKLVPKKPGRKTSYWEIGILSLDYPHPLTPLLRVSMQAIIIWFCFFIITGFTKWKIFLNI
ncbi:hypothetical protein MNBD_GAMMA23-2275 [hydrothermal vent metagenome]|uniref:Transposase and inactivated derivatives n=1 Tax=hydrothermal vent metagenome TaxID=652676 RepID=A0A3B0ZLS2_9ZZZZ